MQQSRSGSILAAERKKQNKTVEDISSMLNLSVTQIKTIELDQAEGLPEPTYVRGYIRSYAKLLGLEPDDVLQHYSNPVWKQAQSLDDIPKNLNNPKRSYKKKKRKSGKFLKLLILASIIFGLWYSGFLNQFLNKESDVALLPSVSTGEDSQETLQDKIVSESAEANTQEATEVEKNSNETNSDEKAESTEPPAQAHALELTFKGTSWVDIRDANDKRLAYKNYAEGDNVVVNSDTPMSVFIGNASGVSVQYNGEAFDIAKYQEGVYAKFVVGE